MTAKCKTTKSVRLEAEVARDGPPVDYWDGVGVGDEMLWKV